MKKDIILSGVGGQGILSIATVIGKVALKEGLYMKQAEVHGMSQRGGDVQSNLRISDQPIASDLIPSGKCDLIISLEPMEGLRYLPYLSPEGNAEKKHYGTDIAANPNESVETVYRVILGLCFQ